MIPPYIPIAGRSASYDKINQAVKQRFPVWFVRLSSRLLAWPRRIRNARRFQQRIAKALPPTARAQFEEMYREAREQWARRDASTERGRVSLPLPGGSRVVELRKGTSDILVYADVIINGQYAAPVAPPVSFILDAGANVGITAAYLLNRFPDARLVALEPDPANATLCRANLAQFETRATVLEAALTPTPTRVDLRAEFQGSWASSVDENPSGDIDGVDIDTICSHFGVKQIDLLKIDIEGAELGIFSHPNREWIARVRAVLVELESAASEAAFFAAMGTQAFQYARYGEITAATRIEAEAAAS